MFMSNPGAQRRNFWGVSSKGKFNELNFPVANIAIWVKKINKYVYVMLFRFSLIVLFVHLYINLLSFVAAVFVPLSKVALLCSLP